MVEDYKAEYAGMEIAPEAGFLKKKQEENYAIEYTDTEIAPGEEHEEDFVEDYMGTEIVPEAEETTHVEDDLSTHIAQVVEEEVYLQNENELTESVEKTQKNEDLDLYADSEPLQKETLFSENTFAEFFETNKNLTYSYKNVSIESTEHAESIDENEQAVEIDETIEVEEALEVLEFEEAEKDVDASRLSENMSTVQNVGECVEDNKLEGVSFCQIDGREEGTVHSEKVTVGTVEETVYIEEIARNKFVLGADNDNITKSNYSPEQHCEVREEVSPTENVISVNDEDVKNPDFISKISKLKPEMEKKESFLNQVHKHDLSGVSSKKVHVNEVMKAKNLAVENKVRQKARPSFEELKNDLMSLSQLIHSAPRRVKKSAVKSTQN